MAYLIGENDELGDGRVDYPADIIVTCRFIAGSSGTARSMYMYGWIDPGESARLVIYDNSGNLLGYTNPLPDGIGWNAEDLVAEVSISSGQGYYLGLHTGDIIGQVGTTWEANLNKDASSQTWESGAPDPFPTDENNYTGEMNIYADDAWINPPAVEASAAVLLML